MELAIADPGLLYGATVFTTLRVYDHSLAHKLTNWQKHCDRLVSSLQTFGWQQPNWQRLRAGAETLIAFFPVLRITLFSDGSELLTGRLLPAELTQKQQLGVAAILATAELQRSLPSHKTGNYLSAWLAKTLAAQMSAEEAILVNEQGNWLETATGNLWGWRDRTWWTPPLTAGILPGIMRSQLIDWLSRHNQPPREEPWTEELVKGFEAIAYTNSVVEVIPIHTVTEWQNSSNHCQLQVNQLKYDPCHPSLQQLRAMFSS